ncbi:MAG: hypothetical protein JWR89_4419 [Tardiphaga sp.]|jgi:hypothetical protein|uniref:hypothetical protein n=1 Tax=Tardiphaga sp. TaxID=1926292 RepID=UPI002624AEBC|nr:hypothetical protein [Tardiphaga sp.]MDB5504517.1 hypothetical protein [Tardiphaga sp.]
MTIYSIVKIGSDYVVQVDRQSVMKFSSRRQAARSVAEASGLLAASLVPHDTPDEEAPEEEPDEPVIRPSISRDSPELA